MFASLRSATTSQIRSIRILTAMKATTAATQMTTAVTTTTETTGGAAKKKRRAAAAGMEAAMRTKVSGSALGGEAEASSVLAKE